MGIEPPTSCIEGRNTGPYTQDVDGNVFQLHLQKLCQTLERIVKRTVTKVELESTLLVSHMVKILVDVAG